MSTPRPLAPVAIGLNLLAALLCGCATGRSFDASAPIDIRSGGSSYEQNGEQLDESDMLEKLSRNPATQHEANSAKNFATVSVVMGAAGGGLVGWPIGEAIAGAKDPKWILAAIGAGVVLVALPLSYQASLETKQAVKTHNQRLALRRDQPKTAAQHKDVSQPAVMPASSASPSAGDTTPMEQQAPLPPESPW